MGKIEDNVLVFKNMFDLIKDLVFLMETDGESYRYLYLNRSALNLQNITGDIIGKTLEDVLPKERANFLLSKYHQVKNTLKPLEYVEEMQTETDEFIGETSLSPILNEDGQCKYVLAIVRDISERIRKERELKETKRTLIKNQKRLGSLIEHNGDAVFELDLEGNFVSVNKKATHLTGYYDQEVIGQSFVPLIDSSCLHSTMTHFKHALAGENVEYETTLHTKNGQKIELLVKNVPIIVDDILVGIYGIAKDITQTNLAQKALREATTELQKSEEKFRLITETAFDVIKIINPEGSIDYASPSNQKILGYPYSEYVGQSLSTYIHPDDRSLLVQVFSDLKSGGKPSHIEYRHRHISGHYIWMEASTIPVTENGELKQLVSIARDITDRKAYRDELAKMAFYDYLTGLPNRRVFDEKLETGIQQVLTSNKNLAVMMLDGRKLKQINDTYGHDAGDAMLKEMAIRLQSSIGNLDTVARLGGDEFGVILPEIDSIDRVLETAKRILSSFETPLTFNNNEIRMGAGIGIALYPDHSRDKKKLVKCADEALYETKKSEENEYRMYENPIENN